MSRGMGGHQSPKMVTDEWLTPPEIIEALGPFDLDPCAVDPSRRPWPTASHHYCKGHKDGLQATWFGNVWCNPPYGRDIGKWLQRCAEHGQATALIFARVETRAWFNWVWSKASGVLFIEGRLHFYHANGERSPHNSGAPSALVAYGSESLRRLTKAWSNRSIPGKLVEL